MKTRYNMFGPEFHGQAYSAMVNLTYYISGQVHKMVYVTKLLKYFVKPPYKGTSWVIKRHEKYFVWLVNNTPTNVIC